MKNLKKFYQQRRKMPFICRGCGAHHQKKSFYCSDCHHLAATWRLVRALRQRCMGGRYE